MATDTLTPAPARTQRAHHQWWVLAVLATAQLMVVLDATVVNIALPSAQHDLGFSDSNRQWIVTAYALAFGSLLLLGSRVADLIGRRTALLVGMAGFAIASAIGGAATGFGMLVVARAAQGAFGALLAPAILAILTTTFADPAARTKAFGVFGAVASSGAGVGLLLGGVLTEYLSWRWCLYVNIPVSVVAILGVLAYIAPEERNPAAKLDIPGAVVVTGGLVSLVYGFARADTDGWTDGVTLGLFVVGAVALAVFVRLQQRVRHPLMPLRVVLDRARGGSYVSFAFSGIGMFGVFLFLTYFLEGTMGYSPVITGAAFLPFVAGILVSSNGGAALLIPRLGKRGLMVLGMSVAAGGLVLLTQIGQHSTYATEVLPGMVLVGLGIGAVFPPGLDFATGGVTDEDAGVASAMINVTQQVGGSIGTALLNTIATTAAASFATSHGGDLGAAAVHSYVVVFWIGAGIFAAGAVVTRLLLPPGRELAAGPGGPVVTH